MPVLHWPPRTNKLVSNLTKQWDYLFLSQSVQQDILTCCYVLHTTTLNFLSITLCLTKLQGVRKFPPQLCQALASSYFVTMKYPFNHVILTPREFFWHMKHNSTFISSWVMDGNTFLQHFCKTEFLPCLTLQQKMKYPKMPSRAYRVYFYHFHDDLHGP